MNKLVFFFLSFLTIPLCISAQEYSLLIKGGHLIDPKNNVSRQMDIGIFEGKVKKVAQDIDPASARQVVDAKGMYVTPGLIDIHGHVFAGTKPNHYLSDGFIAIPPDGFTFRVGVTTIVDCGGAGWSNFDTFKQNIIFNSKTRVLSFLNIVGQGMRGGKWEQDTSDMDPGLAAAIAMRNRNDIVGFKVAHFQGRDWTVIDNAVKAGEIAKMPVIVDFGGAQPPLPLDELFLRRLRPGDIFTHTYTLLPNDVRETIVDEEKGKVKPFVWEAKKRGIVFDVGYGGASFNYTQAIPAIKEGFFPTTISTDLHTGSMNGSMKDMLSVMSKFYQMGMKLEDVIKASTWTPAVVIQREILGHLSEGAIADIAVFSMRKGNFGFYDKTGYKVTSKEKLECELTVKGGSIVYDLNGIADPIYWR